MANKHGAQAAPKKQKQQMTNKKKDKGESRALESRRSTAVSSYVKKEPQFPLAAFLFPFRHETSAWKAMPIILMVALLFRAGVGFYWGYSGHQSPLMYGDFEAQRHWMELTIHVSPAKWYFYDLQYWGLDYPPLTAYHSWVMGKIASLFDPAWVALDTSRGLEHPDLKLYMRSTVLASEFLVYVPALGLCVRCLTRLLKLQIGDGWILFAAVLMQPATLLIDHGHFQYNTVMLGLVLGAVTSVFAGSILWCAVLFVAALAYKQMALYFAPVFFAFLLGFCVFLERSVVRLAAVATATAAAFVCMEAPHLVGAIYSHWKDPLLITTLEASPLFNFIHERLPISFERTSMPYALLLQLTQIVHRVFPFARGVFEDKVANLWCVLHTIYKLNRLPTYILPPAALALTLLATLPACIAAFLTPTKHVLLPAMASGAWAFFLCSFQVHEKSVLLPLLPTTLLLAVGGGIAPATRAWVGFANTLGTWTLFPLLRRDEVKTPYVVLVLLWAWFLGLPPVNWTLYQPDRRWLSPAIKPLHSVFYVVMVVWHLAEAFVPAPKGKPDLWVVLNCVVGAAGFGVCYLWTTWQVAIESGFADWATDKMETAKEAREQEVKMRAEEKQATSSKKGPSAETPGKKKGKKKAQKQ